MLTSLQLVSHVECTSRLAVATVSGCGGRVGPDLGAPPVACVFSVSQAWFPAGVDHEDLTVKAEVVSVKHIESLCVHQQPARVGQWDAPLL